MPIDTQGGTHAGGHHGHLFSFKGSGHGKVFAVISDDLRIVQVFGDSLDASSVSGQDHIVPDGSLFQLDMIPWIFCHNDLLLSDSSSSARRSERYIFRDRPSGPTGHSGESPKGASSPLPSVRRSSFREARFAYGMKRRCTIPER